MKPLMILALAGLPLAAPAQDRAGDFDYYLLSLSWGPTWCRQTGDRSDAPECAAGSGGDFTVHGLWPQYERGYPAFCEPSGRPVSRPALEEAEGVFPDEGLARYEWRKHGTCTGESPAEYFRAARRARDLVAIPESLRSPRAEARVLPLAIERAGEKLSGGERPDHAHRVDDEEADVVDPDVQNRAGEHEEERERDGLKIVRRGPANEEPRGEEPHEELGSREAPAVRAMLREELLALVGSADRSLHTAGADGRPAVVLVVGVNGTGKTTTVGKLARVLVAEDRTVLLAAADTFRAAAADQLSTWGERVGAPVVRGPEGGDPASVAFDAVQQGTLGKVLVDLP